MIAVRVGDDGDGDVAYGVLLGEPKRWGIIVTKSNVTKHKWAVKMAICSKWEGDEVCYVHNEDTKDVLIPLSTVVVPPAIDPRRPQEFLPFTKRSTLIAANARLALDNWVIDEETRSNIVAWAEM